MHGPQFQRYRRKRPMTACPSCFVYLPQSRAPRYSAVNSGRPGRHAMHSDSRTVHSAKS